MRKVNILNTSKRFLRRTRPPTGLRIHRPSPTRPQPPPPPPRCLDPSPPHPMPHLPTTPHPLSPSLPHPPRDPCLLLPPPPPHLSLKKEPRGCLHESNWTRYPNRQDVQRKTSALMNTRLFALTAASESGLFPPPRRSVDFHSSMAQEPPSVDWKENKHIHI